MDYWFLYYVLLIAIIVWSLIVQSRLKSCMREGSRIMAASGITAEEALRQILAYNNVVGYNIEYIGGEASDAYNASEGTVYLSDTTYGKRDLTALAIAAHEGGHVMQHASGMGLFRARQFLAPIAGLCSNLGIWIAVIGLFVSYAAENSGYAGFIICNIGVFVYLFAFVFFLIMVPVERDASRRALANISSLGLVSPEQLPLAKRLLRSAGNTYVVALASSALTLVRLLLIRGSSRRS